MLQNITIIHFANLTGSTIITGFKVSACGFLSLKHSDLGQARTFHDLLLFHGLRKKKEMLTKCEMLSINCSCRNRVRNNFFSFVSPLIRFLSRLFCSLPAQPHHPFLSPCCLSSMVAIMNEPMEWGKILSPITVHQPILL